VAYLECAGGVQGKAPVGVCPQKLKLFVNECLNFDVQEEKIIVKQQKLHYQKLGSAERRPRRKAL